MRGTVSYVTVVFYGNIDVMFKTLVCSTSPSSSNFPASQLSFHPGCTLSPFALFMVVVRLSHIILCATLLSGF